jgi:glucose-6-phosphate dehydrogenase assembly protein OpcA
MNLVLVAASPALAATWVPMVDDVLSSVPARAIVIGLDPDGSDELEADVSATCTPGAEGVVCSERVTLTVHGAFCGRLASCVDSIRATDVPLTLVWLARVHSGDRTFAPLAREASRIVLDAGHGSMATLAFVMRWTRERPVGEQPGVADLAWTRIGPWQELCAGIFDSPRLCNLAHLISRVRIVQASPPGSSTLGAEGALLLGWLATRLGWKIASLSGKLRLVRPDGGFLRAQLVAQRDTGAPPGSLVSLELEANDGTLSVRGNIARVGLGDMVVSSLDVSCDGEHRHFEQQTSLRGNAPARLLERTLHRPPHDEALAESVAWADELRGEELECN